MYALENETCTVGRLSQSLGGRKPGPLWWSNQAPNVMAVLRSALGSAACVAARRLSALRSLRFVRD